MVYAVQLADIPVHVPGIPPCCEHEMCASAVTHTHHHLGNPFTHAHVHVHVHVHVDVTDIAYM